MAKAEKQVEAVEVVPQVAFQKAWDANKDNMRAIVTRKGQVRGQITPSQVTKAQELLRSYGL